METIEIRCPIGPQRLLSKLLVRGQHPAVTTDNLIEFACSDCKQTLQKQGQKVRRILHRYDLSGDLIETVIERGGR
jgi:hypothetical protein